MLLSVEKAHELFPKIREINKYLAELPESLRNGFSVSELIKLNNQFLSYEDKLGKGEDEKILQEMDGLREQMSDVGATVKLLIERSSMAAVADALLKVTNDFGLVPASSDHHHK